jgi:homoserine O-acetyltransferase
MLVKKERFSVDSFHFETSGVSIPVAIGYESYGTLNKKKDNVLLVCHYFTGTGHAAGKYADSDALPGWWDGLIGPGKPLDTDKYFILCTDCISNINFHNPNVITTGPGTINPKTGKPYAMDFPIFTLKDMVRLQKQLLDHLGIASLKAVIGPSMGGLQAFMWGRQFPDMVEKIVSVVATPMVTPFVLMVPNQLGIDAIRMDPKWQSGNYYGGEPPLGGLLNAFKVLLMITRTDAWADANFGRKFADSTFKEVPDPRTSFQGKYLVEQEVEKTVLGRMQFFDPNAYLYIAKANALYDLAEGDQTMEEALRQIRAKTLMIIDDSDLMFTRRQAEIAKNHLPDAQTFYYDSGNGHLSCLFDQPLFSDVLGEFLLKGKVSTKRKAGKKWTSFQ